jgi:RNA polymerase sigma-70 factor (ECF subfamily)
MDGDPDEDLIRRVAAGEPRAMRMLMTEHLPRIMALATRMLGTVAGAEDVAQETFVRIWTNAARWNSGGARFSTWVHRVVLNLCYDQLRRRAPIASGDPPDVPDAGPAPDAGLLAEDSGHRVERALQSLAPRQREAIILVYYQGLSNIEAASVMNVSVDALESLLARGRRSLQLALMKEQADG